MKKNLLLVFFCACSVLLAAQTAEPPFRKDINAFKKEDSLRMTYGQPVLFIGSSSFTYWKDIKDYFPGHPILNRGFGGSSLPDLIRYAPEIIFPYHPKQIIIYCGENDLAAADSITPQTVADRFRTLFGMIRQKFKRVPIAFVSIKPSPSRWKLEPEFVEANNLIKAFLRTRHRTRYIDVHTAMLQADGSVKKELFIADQLHMNAMGYAIWKEKIGPVLIR